MNLNSAFSCYSMRMLNGIRHVGSHEFALIRMSCGAAKGTATIPMANKRGELGCCFFEFCA